METLDFSRLDSQSAYAFLETAETASTSYVTLENLGKLPKLNTENSTLSFVLYSCAVSFLTLQTGTSVPVVF